MFSDCGKALSIDAWLRKKRNPDRTVLEATVVAWPVRMMQIQLCIMYLCTVFWKIKGQTWTDGTAAFFMLKLDEFHRFPLPDFMQTLWFSHVGTWGGLMVEALFPILVWVKECRKVVVLLALALHLGLEYSMNIPVFQWVVIAALVLFWSELKETQKAIPMHGQLQNA